MEAFEFTPESPRIGKHQSQPALGSGWRRAGICALLALLLAGCGHAPSHELVVGMELAYPPFETIDTSGNPAGVSVDLAKALGDYLHRPVRVENIPFDGLIPALKSGKIDLIISSMTATPERAESIDFSDPYLKTGLCLLVRAESNIRSIADVDRPEQSIAVKKGTTGFAYASASIKKAKLIVLDKEAACVIEVVQGKAGAFIYDQMSTYRNWKNNPDTTRALLKPFQEESWAVGIRKGNDALREQVNAFLADYRARGGFDSLGDKYLKEEKEAFRKSNVPFFF